MLSQLKWYLGLMFLLIGAQIVVAAERTIEFQKALNEFKQSRVASD